MNCDVAFELMTDVHGCDNQLLRMHLESCPRCRQMQETLSPALEWLVERAAHPGESRPEVERVPWNLAASGPLTAEAVEVARDSARVLSGQRGLRAIRPRRWMGCALGYAACLLVGGGLALALAPVQRNAALPAEETACRRLELENWSARNRATGELTSLIASCAACHTAPPERVEPVQQTSAWKNPPALWISEGHRASPTYRDLLRETS
ncbi:MAG: hypothetical protein ACKV0T_29525 [Planctomycetales bacterium]